MKGSIRITIKAIFVTLLYVSIGCNLYATEPFRSVYEAYKDLIQNEKTCESMSVSPPNEVGRYIEMPDYTGYVMPYDMAMYPYYNWCYPSGIWHLSDDDVVLAETIMRAKLPEFCIARWAIVPEVFNDLSKFIRQYTGVIIVAGEFKGQRLVIINLVNAKAYRDMEMNHPEYFTEKPESDRVRIYEGFLHERLYDEDDINWDRLFAISLCVNITGEYIEYVNYNGYAELGYKEY